MVLLLKSINTYNVHIAHILVWKMNIYSLRISFKNVCAFFGIKNAFDER